MFDLHVHDNLIRNIHCDGINFATVDPSKGAVEAYNNVLYHVGTGVLNGDQSSFACIYFPGILNAGPAPSGTAQVFNNTCYDFGAVTNNGESGGFSVLPSGTMTVNFRNNILYALPGESYISSNGLANKSVYTGSNNLFFGSGSAPTFFTASVNADPKMVSPPTGDFHLQAGSAALDAGVLIGSLVADRDGVRRPQGAAYDIGALELFTGGSTLQRPNPPTSLTVIVH